MSSDKRTHIFSSTIREDKRKTYSYLTCQSATGIKREHMPVQNFGRRVKISSPMRQPPLHATRYHVVLNQEKYTHYMDLARQEPRFPRILLARHLVTWTLWDRKTTQLGPPSSQITLVPRRRKGQFFW